MRPIPLPPRWLAALLLASTLCGLSSPALAVVRRHDVDDADYIALGSPANFPASGFITAGNGALLGGTLIDPLYFVTAAHISGDIVPGVTTFTIGGAAYVIAEQRPHPSFNSTGKFENDINVVRLATAVGNVTPTPYNMGLPELGSTATTIGYGQTGTGLTGSTGPAGQRRGAQNVVDLIGDGAVFPPTAFLADFDNPTPAGAIRDNSLGAPTALAFEGTLALFDSGGGVYANLGTGRVLIGINSFTASVDGTPNNDYSDLFGATRVGLYSDYIAMNVPEPSTAVLTLIASVLSAGVVRRRTRTATGS